MPVHLSTVPSAHSVRLTITASRSSRQQQQAAAQQAAGTNQGRGDATSALAAVMADAKYSRQEAASPVQSTLNQQVKVCRQRPAACLALVTCFTEFRRLASSLVAQNALSLLRAPLASLFESHRCVSSNLLALV